MKKSWDLLGVLLGAFALTSSAVAEPVANAPANPTPISTPSQLRPSLNRYPSLPETQFALAQHYATGQEVRKDPYLAALWAKRAALGGSANALSWLRTAAESGDAIAQWQYGAVCELGSGTSRDPKAAQAWFAKAFPTLQAAAAGGDVYSATTLGTAYAKGLGVKLDLANARTLFNVAAAKFYLPALSAFGEMLMKGEGGPQKSEDGLKIIEGAAALGDVPSARTLAALYKTGELGAKDTARAAQWLRVAGYAGDEDSQVKLAHLLAEGDGVPRDFPGAIEMYQLAAAQGSAEAANNLGLLVRDGEGTPADPTGALEWFKKAVELGTAYGAYNLGVAYRDGQGTAVDLGQAQSWLTRAVKGGQPAAKQALTRIATLNACRQRSHLTMLFGEPLRCTTRNALRQAIARGGATATREKDSFWYDTYDSSTVLENSKELGVGYTMANGEFARATYEFPSSLDKEQVVRVADMVAVKYGSPRRRQGNVELGPASFEWTLPDGVVLRVSRDWPDTTTFLEYSLPERLAQLTREQAENDKKALVQKSLAQSGAF